MNHQSEEKINAFVRTMVYEGFSAAKQLYPDVADHLGVCQADCLKMYERVATHPGENTIRLYQGQAVTVIPNDHVRFHLEAGCTECWKFFDSSGQLD